MPEPEEQDLPFARSSIAAIGSRRRWRFFGGVVEDDASPADALPESPADGNDDEPPGRSMLGLGVFSGVPSSASDSVRRVGAGGSGDGDAAPFLTERSNDGDHDEPPVRSMLGRLSDEAGSLAPEAEEDEDAGPATMLSLGGAVPGAPAAEEDFGHLTQHSTIAELAGLEEHVANEWPIERGVLISLLFHISLMLMLLFFPSHLGGSRGGDLFAMLEPQPRDNTPIPVILDAPGPKRANPKPAPLSDADRRASGGDRSKPKSDTPFIPKTNGIEGLAQGPRAPRIPGSPGPSRPAQQAVPPQQAAGNQTPDQTKLAEKSPDAKSSEFPTDTRQGQTGPREVGKLANLGQAIQDAARGAVAGGEGGAPPANPDGGFVDSGPISFDTKWYDWGAYAAEMVRRIKLHWDIPELARLGWKGSLTVRFYIMADGTVADPKIIRVSGIPPFDNAAFQAIVKSSPFRPLPEVLHEEREGVTVTFFYNMRPESEEARAQP
ncbi:MAG TPA: TonB family protein [Thermoanaerobaculia bacterium]|nr:TonB family protein [Thermoanaerobaculia bacterium]